MSEPTAAVPAALVLGGARSGKSRHALALAEASGLEPVFIATGQPFDEEMRARIAHHRQERSPRWRTLEAPLELASTLADAARPGRVVLVDCLTLWLGNLVLNGRDPGAATRELAALAMRLPAPAVFVSNEVGSGIVPETPLGRSFRDDQGRLNQAMAAACGSVVLVVAGLPLQLKPGEAPKPAPWVPAG